MDELWQTILRDAPLPVLAGGVFTALVKGIDLWFQRGKTRRETEDGREARLDGRLNSLFERLEGENTRLGERVKLLEDRLDEAERELDECRRGRETALSEIAALKRLREWDGRTERRNRPPSHGGGLMEG